MQCLAFIAHALYTNAFFLSFKIRYVPVLYSNFSSLWSLPCQNDLGKKVVYSFRNKSFF